MPPVRDVLRRVCGPPHEHAAVGDPQEQLEYEDYDVDHVARSVRRGLLPEQAAPGHRLAPSTLDVPRLHHLSEHPKQYVQHDQGQPHAGVRVPAPAVLLLHSEVEAVEIEYEAEARPESEGDARARVAIVAFTRVGVVTRARVAVGGGAVVFPVRRHQRLACSRTRCARGGTHYGCGQLVEFAGFETDFLFF